MSSLRLSYLQKVGGGDVCTGHPPHPKKWGGGGDTSPIPPGFTPVHAIQQRQQIIIVPFTHLQKYKRIIIQNVKIYKMSYLYVSAGICGNDNLCDCMNSHMSCAGLGLDWIDTLILDKQITDMYVLHSSKYTA